MSLGVGFGVSSFFLCACVITPFVRSVHPEFPSRAASIQKKIRYVIGRTDVQLEHLEEVFTSENWIVRIYRLKEQKNRGGVGSEAY